MPVELIQGDALDAKAFRAAMDAYYEACRGYGGGKRRVASAIRAYLRVLEARRLIGDAPPGEVDPRQEVLL